jgi:hypothetical protein
MSRTKKGEKVVENIKTKKTLKSIFDLVIVV